MCTRTFSLLRVIDTEIGRISLENSSDSLEIL